MPNGIINYRRPSDDDAEARMLAIWKLREELRQQEATGRRKDPLEMAKEQATARQYEQRRDVSPLGPAIAMPVPSMPGREGPVPMPEPRLVRGVSRITDGEMTPARRNISTQFGASPQVVQGMRPIGTGPTFTAMRQQAETLNDPNRSALLGAQEEEARLDPRVLAANVEAQGRRDVADITAKTKPAKPIGRPMFSGDANRIAEIDNSIADAKKLRLTLGKTGAASKIGTMVPNVVTELTGWGSDAKSRQGTIDRVKQVIGKALEGGVLRKEDEYKYVKILPTIGDPPEVAESKLTGLDAALEDKRQITLDALGDAGFDTEKFRERKRRATDRAGQPTIGERRIINGEEGEWDGEQWIAAE